MGYSEILWADAQMVMVRPPANVFSLIEKDGHVFFYGGFFCHQWTSDLCLGQMRVTRLESSMIHQISACCMGFNAQNSTTRQFLRELKQHSLDGLSFPGSWTNERFQVSSDPTCEGHRHDQSVCSILAHKHGMSLQMGPHFMAYRDALENTSGYDASWAKPTVELVNQGP